jgi:hypothetical protein
MTLYQKLVQAAAGSTTPPTPPVTPAPAAPKPSPTPTPPKSTPKKSLGWLDIPGAVGDMHSKVQEWDKWRGDMGTKFDAWEQKINKWDGMFQKVQDWGNAGFMDKILTLVRGLFQGNWAVNRKKEASVKEDDFSNTVSLLFQNKGFRKIPAAEYTT